MWPWGHLAFAYLVYRAYRATTPRKLPKGVDVWALAFGALLPDLIDKTFTWTIPILPGGRSLTHSVFTIGLIGIVLYWSVETSRHRRLALPGYLGLISHPVADAIPGLAFGDLQALYFMNWPLGPHPIYTTEPSFIAHFAGLGEDLMLLSHGQYSAVGFLVYELILVVISGSIWFNDGAPGLHEVGKVAVDVYTRATDRQQV